MGILSIMDMSGTSHIQTLTYGVTEGEVKEKGVKNLFEEVMAGNFHYMEIWARNKHAGPGHPDSPKHDKPKEVHTKRHNN